MTLKLAQDSGIIGKGSGPDEFDQMPQVGNDPIVESGSNSDGNWTRWADGTQITSGTETQANGATALSGSLYGSSLFLANFPVAFLVAPSVTARAVRTSGEGVVWPGTDDKVDSATQCGIRIVGSTSDIRGFIRICAIGRWK